MDTKAIAALVLALFLVGIFVGSAIAEPMKPLRCELEMDVDWANMKWDRTTTGDIE